MFEHHWVIAPQDRKLSLLDGTGFFANSYFLGGSRVSGLIETITNSVQLKLELELSLAKMHSSTLLELCTYKNIYVIMLVC